MNESGKGTASEFIAGDIQDVVVYPLKKFFDDRGWLAELFRHDEIAEEFYPAMSYISFTKPGIHRMWDNRPDSPTHRYMMSFDAGVDEPRAVIVPKGVVHGYKNIGDIDGMVINCPNRLYMGEGKKEPIDEIRHEDDPDTIYRMD
jgi:dTDP-4-dehydrorhamnose 3,5-epimerase